MTAGIPARHVLSDSADVREVCPHAFTYPSTGRESSALVEKGILSLVYSPCLMADPHPLSVSAARVLTNPHLLHAIFTFLPLTQDGRDSYLARCATVCRAFQEPADRILWRNLDALLPLWHILAPSNIPFPSRYYYYNSDDGLHDHGEVLTYLQKVSTFVSRTSRLAHKVSLPGQLCAFISRSNTMEPLSMAYHPCP